MHVRLAMACVPICCLLALARNGARDHDSLPGHMPTMEITGLHAVYWILNLKKSSQPVLDHLIKCPIHLEAEVAK